MKKKEKKVKLKIVKTPKRALLPKIPSRGPKGLAIVLSVNPALAWQIPFQPGDAGFVHDGKKYEIAPDKFYFLKAKLTNKKRYPVLFYNEGDPKPIDLSYKFKEVLTYGGDETFNFTGSHLYVLSQEAATGLGVKALKGLGEGPRARKMGWLFWLVIIGVIAAVLVMFGPRIFAGIRGLI